ncbi:hypothetical protein OIU34_22105 [Pararhizobium sp. BT-229]|uniref:hypothetical protein n=1 Tax=Pararhizobium sp. BT-229 TaxID=2986923 RepID=UPI0021F6E37A|nr:hypothetical protein [Pararhizobium sp. BT-229]MCV9964587.1 hypothetical protein [Pararhizobium sp. BT-229]
MLRDTIQNVPDDCLALGSTKHTHRYNGFEFKLEVTAHPATHTSNDRAKKLSVLHMEANIRKSTMGLGMGQYLKPEEIQNLQNGRVMLSATIAGKYYNIPLSVTPRGEYSSEVLKGKYGSLRDITAKVMDGIFEHNGIDNMYANSGRLAARGPAHAPATAGFGMRM